MEALFIDPRIDELMQGIQNAERLRECLQLRISLSKKDLSSKSLFEKNEVEILELETNMKINAASDIINKRRYQFNEAFIEVISELFNKDHESDDVSEIDRPETIGVKRSFPYPDYNNYDREVKQIFDKDQPDIHTELIKSGNQQLSDAIKGSTKTGKEMKENDWH